MITDFPQNPFFNVAGMAGFRFAPAEYLSVLPPVILGTVTGAIEFYNPYRLFNGYCTPGKLVFSETPEKTTSGTLYKWKLTGFMPGDVAGAEQLLAEMETYKHLLIVQDLTGQERLVGHAAPLDFAAEFNSGSTAGDARGYTYIFSGESSKRAPVYRMV